MKVLFVALTILSLALLGAHFLRFGNVIGVVTSIALIGLLFFRKAWVARLIQVALVFGTLEWAHTLYELVQIRMAHGAPYARMATIIGVVTVITLGSALLFQTEAIRRMYGMRTQDKAAN